MRIVFAGTPDFAARHLQALLDAKLNIVGVYSQPDRPAGRGKKLQASPVKNLALEHQLPVYQPVSFKATEAQQQLAELKPDLMIVVAYGLLLPQAVLDAPTHGCINVHGSLLPKWRGAAPIQRAIWAGDAHTGVTIMQMDAGLDTGPMLHKAVLEISPQETSASLYSKLAELGPQALIHCLNNWDSLVPEAQDNDQASYAKKLSKEEALIDWRLSAAQLEHNVRAFNPWPVAYFHHQDNGIKVWQASVEHQQGEPGQILAADKSGILVACQEHSLRLQTLQWPGKKPTSAQDILNSRAELFAPGIQLSLP